MAQLLEMLSARPEIICILLFWPFLLWVLKVISQKVLAKYEAK
jgi:hypothetical protein